MEKIHAGCGKYRVPGWLNIELMSLTEIPYGKLIHAGDAYLLNFDLTAGIPVADNQATHLYNSHFIEHLTLEQGRRFLSEAYRILKPGGRIRITCPALDVYVKHYQARDQEYFRRVYQAGASFPGLVTPGHILMGQMHGWGHQWIYDHESMAYELQHVGFKDIITSAFRASDFPDLDQLEPDTEARTIQSLYMEGYKR
ncbi:MAG TPA: methyltransferase domain-containing protein [Kiritimatiellia bacterium]|nr:methyltransferase domain-containing protein [Kiritimatiellia bacterium]HMO98659.1 methyltransferase domain-containing protein [Kiritimatiellia bacterium]HMP90854.1 methyltransferase domain-containing protein [Kiritimatiellia bacterium]